MKQILQDMQSGETTLVDAPDPQVGTYTILIRTTKTLVSAGTERMLVDFGKASYLQKARQQPEKVKQVLDKVSTDGLMTTIDAVRSKLSEPLPLGYCHVGVVEQVGDAVTDFTVGDRVISNGSHASLVAVGEKLCCKIPAQVSDEQAAFTVLASIGLQGIRLANPTLGESVVVIGAGLIGLLTVQLLVANGCRVLAIDFDQSKLKLARSFGAETYQLSEQADPVQAGIDFSGGQGVDAVLITASTKSNDPVSQAAQMSRKRGRIVLVGVTGLELNRAEFYQKELSFQVSCSYGPGRYDPNYEQLAQDYPLGFVRWTQQRNFAAILALLAENKLNVTPLISELVDFESAPEAYQRLSDDKSLLGVILDYQKLSTEPVTVVSLQDKTDKPRSSTGQSVVVAALGAGNFASRVLLPALKSNEVELHTLISKAGTSGAVHGKRQGFRFASTDLQGTLANQEVNTVFVLTRHNLHAEQTVQALQAGKHVFVEKPLAVTEAQLETVKQAYEESSNQLVMVGFNRRFSPYITKMKALINGIKQPKSMIFTANAGAIPADHWTQDADIGGGRLIGEACHYIDLLRFMVDAPIVNSSIVANHAAGDPLTIPDNFSINLGFADGSHGTVHYFSNGPSDFPKERLELFCAGKGLQLDNFKTLRGYGFKGFKKQSGWRQEKGHAQEISAFLQAIRQGKPSPIAWPELLEVSALSIQLTQQLLDNKRS